ncbi:MAG: type II secretion system F family protein [Phycisphaerae bacterium]|nr:type II secretion system F family protein [Phycisphaerae bacterium]
MPAAGSASTYFFIATKSGGGRSYGLRTARSRPALAEQLRRERKLLLRSYRVPGVAAPQRALRLKDHAVLNEQLGQLLARGVPLVEALEVAGQTVTPPARPVVERMRESVASGASFSEACRATGAFDDVTVAVYRAAEKTGDLAGSTRQLAINARRTLQVAGRATTLMIYPAVVLSISLVVAFVMMAAIVPRLGEQLKDADVPLPFYSRMVMGLGAWMSEYLVLLLLAILAAVVALIVFRRAVGSAWAALMRRLPMLSDVLLAQESARFFSVMAAMTRSGVPLADALGTANQAINHPVLRSQMDRLRTRLVEGGLLRTLIEQVEALPLATRKLLVAAERAGDLESAFNSLASDMTDEVEKRSSRLLAVLQPALIVLMFVIIGSLLLAILIPLLTLGGQVGR